MRTKKKVTIAGINLAPVLVISWPAEWTTEKAVQEIKAAFADAVDVTFGDDTDEFPDLEFTPQGLAYSLYHLLH